MNLMTRKEVAEYYGVSLWTIINWENKGFLEAKRIGHSVMYSRDEIESKKREDFFNKRIN